MAGYRAANGVLQALKDRLSWRMAALLGGEPTVSLLGSLDLHAKPTSEALGIYLYRFAVDHFARNRYLTPLEGHRIPRPELPVNLHVLLIGWSNKTESEVAYLASAMQIIGSAMTLGLAHLGGADPAWGESDTVQVVPEEMSTVDLARLWESLPGGYRLSVPYVIKTVRLAPDEELPEGPLVRTLVYPIGSEVETAP